jgi:hypothetical protein
VTEGAGAAGGAARGSGGAGKPTLGATNGTGTAGGVGGGVGAVSGTTEGARAGGVTKGPAGKGKMAEPPGQRTWTQCQDQEWVWR